MQTDKIAVIELSTKAVKWLIPQVDNETIQNSPFDFKFFFRESQKTETGNGLNNSSVLDERYFISRVLPYIKKAYDAILAHDVDVVYCIATAVYRSASNINSILQIIREKTGLEVKVLTKEEEAEYTFWAYFYSTRNKELLLQKPYALLIDQGGGSTEITLFHKQELVFRKSFDMGTTILKNDFFSQQNVQTLDRLNYIDSKYKSIIRQDLLNINLNNFPVPLSNENIYCICVGTSVTAAFGVGSMPNKEVHEKRLDKDQIQNIIDSRTIEFDGFSIRSLQIQIEQNRGTTQTLEKRLASRLGLPIIKEILHFFNVHGCRISGTGLWYGVFYTKFNNVEI